MNVVSIQNVGGALEQVDLPTGFDAFWLLVVKKARKFESKLEWAKLSDEEQTAAIIGAARWRPIWLKMEWQYIVDPCRWLKYRRFEDELPADASAPTSSAHVAFGPSAPLPAKTDIPEHVRALLRKLTGRA